MHLCWSHTVEELPVFRLFLYENKPRLAPICVTYIVRFSPSEAPFAVDSDLSGRDPAVTKLPACLSYVKRPVIESN